MIPADRRDQQRGQRAGHQTLEAVPGLVQQVCGTEPGQAHHHGRHEPYRFACRGAAGEPGDHAAQRLVGTGGHEPGPPRLPEVSVQPPLRRRVRQRDEACHDRRHEYRTGHDRRAEPAGDEQVGDEQQRHQLDRRGDPDPGALEPAPVRLAHVPHDEHHEQQLDLAEVQRPLHRLDPERGPRHQQGPAEPLGPAATHAQLTERDPHRRQQRERARHRRDILQHPPRQERQHREHHRRERRVGEHDARLLVGVPGVQRVRLPPGQLPAFQVNLEVKAIEHRVGRVAGDDDQVGHHRHREHRGTDGQHPAAPRVSTG